ncbi:hypothetical protein [Winogradskyella poriferorum]|uniref:hypothetical protein n=1 Tax=Winogradskyella poriferorum TaxID=307627 RepID=UPI003D65CD10
MSKKVLFETPNLKINLFVLMLCTVLFGYSQTDSRWCGNIESFEFTNGQESVSIENNGNYNIGELPEDFYLNSNIHGYSQSLRYTVTNIDTNQTYQIVENVLPYTFPAGNDAWNIGSGSF